MYFYIFITNGSCTPNPGCRKALSLPEGTPFGVDTQYGKKQFLSPCLSSKVFKMLKKFNTYSRILWPWTKHHETKIWIANFWKPKG